ncbi:MAG: hypothetical protein ACD_75C01523G0005 [uncultured bacterium]|nr:MAG: hypothetical protein ACD_75C01523G0005 [uncultured bacterium]
MHMALSADDWLQLNTSYCKRLAAWITARSCDSNRVLSSSKVGDLRCNGCNGLHDQVLTATPILTDSLHHALAELLEEDTQQEEQSELQNLGDDSGAMDNLSMDEDDLDDEVLALFPELREFFEVREPEQDVPLTKHLAEQEVPITRHKVKASNKKYAVLIGRCKRCHGYMQNDIEWHHGEHDDDIHRCFTCGWRTSPVYAWNRDMAVSLKQGRGYVNS